MRQPIPSIILIFFIACGSDPNYLEVMVNKSLKVYSKDYHNEAENYTFKWEPPIGPSNQPVPFDLKNDMLIFAPDIEETHCPHTPNEYYCNECNPYPFCENCDTYFPMLTNIYNGSDYLGGDDINYCDECFNNDYFYCEYCDEYCSNEKQFISQDDEPYCEKCYDNFNNNLNKLIPLNNNLIKIIHNYIFDN